MTTKQIAQQLGTTEQEIIKIGVDNGIMHPDGTPTQKGYDLGYFEDQTKFDDIELMKIIANLSKDQLQKLIDEVLKLSYSLRF